MGMNEAEVLVDQGKVGEAQVVLRDVARVFLASGDRHTYALCLAFLGRAALREGRLDDATALLATAREEFLEAGAHGDVLEVEAREAELSLFAAAPQDALARADELLARAQAAEDVGPVTTILHRVRGYALAQLADLVGAREAFDASVSAAREKDASHEVAFALQGLLRVAATSGGEPVPGTREECAEILRALGVVAVPAYPVVGLRSD
jgi:predicted negative regulator of RcsB-dependent stress response